MLEFGPDSDDIGEDFVGRLEVLAEKRTLERNAGHLDCPLPFRPDMGNFKDSAGPDELLGKCDEVVEALESCPGRVKPQTSGDQALVQHNGDQLKRFHSRAI